MRPIRTIRGAVFIAFAVWFAVAGTRPAVADETRTDATVADSASEDLPAVRALAETMPIDRRIDMEKRIHATVAKVNDSVKGQGQTALAGRLAPGFGMTGEALLDEKGRLGWTWGDMVVAHALLANAARTVTLVDLETLRSDGLGWAPIAFGLKFHMEDLEDVIKAGGKIAAGLSGPGDGSSARP
jgi:hypothetical protein